MEINAATRSELLRRLAGTAQDTSTAVVASQATVSQLNLLLRCATASEGSDLEQAHQGWHDQLSALSASRMEDDKRRAAELIAMTAQECSSHTFLCSWAAWGAAMSGMIQAEQPSAICAAAWAALSHIIARLAASAEVPGVRRDGSAFVGKLAGVLVSTVLDDGRREAWEPALRTLAATLRALPAALRHHDKALKAAVVHVLTAEPAHTAAQRQAALCLAQLPQINGDADGWSAAAQEALATAHALLSVVAQGLEDAAVVAACRATTDPAAQPVAGLALGGGGGAARSLQPALRCLGALLDTLEHLLTAPFPVPVAVPAAGVLGLVTRLLDLDDGPSGRRPPSASLYLELCAALPGLHVAGLRSVGCGLRAAGGAAAHLHAPAARLLAAQLRRLAAGSPALTPWTVRLAVFESAAELVDVAGLGGARLLVPPAVDVLQAELVQGRSAAGPAAAGDAGAGSRPAKRRKGHGGKPAAAGDISAFEDALQAAAAGAATAGATTEQRDAVVAVAALALLETLLRTGGAALPLQQRAQLDALAAHSAQAAAAAAATASQAARGNAAEAGLLRLAAFRALLASVLAPAACRPAFLPEALSLFQRHVSHPNPALATFCSQALASCEALLHPRAATLFPARPPPAAAAAAAAAVHAQQAVYSSRPDDEAVAAVQPAATQAANVNQQANLDTASAQPPAAAHAIAAAVEPALPAAGGVEMAEAVRPAQAAAEAAAAEVAAPQLLVAAKLGPAAAAAVQPALQQPNGSSAEAQPKSTTPSAVQPAGAPANGRLVTAVPPAAEAKAAAPAADGPASKAAAAAGGTAPTELAATAAAPAFAAEQYSSDSEGSLPEIDSGGSESGSSSGGEDT